MVLEARGNSLVARADGSIGRYDGDACATSLILVVEEGKLGLSHDDGIGIALGNEPTTLSGLASMS